MKTTFMALWVLSATMAVGAESPFRWILPARTPMPACAELEKAPAAGLLGYLENDRKGLSGSCVEFAIRRLDAVVDDVPVADAERAVRTLMPFLDFPSTMNGSWYPAKNTIVNATNSVVRRFRDAQEDFGPVQQPVLDKLVELIADPTVSDTVADSAAWAVDQIMAYPHPAAGPLPAVTMLVSASKASASKRLWDEAHKLAAACAGSALQSQCDAALN